RSGISSPTTSPSAPTPRCGRRTGPGSCGRAWARTASRSSGTSPVSRAIQSSARLSRLITNLAPSPRSRRVIRAPDQPSVWSGSSATPVSPLAARTSARGGYVIAAVGPAVDVDHVRIRAVPGEHDDQRLVGRRVLLDVDLARRDVHEVAGRGGHLVLEDGGSPRVPRRPADDVDAGLARPVVMDPGLAAGRRGHDG